MRTSMGETKFLYHEKYPVGTLVNIAKRNVLEDFFADLEAAQQIEAGATRLLWQNRNDKIRRVLPWRRCAI